VTAAADPEVAPPKDVFFQSSAGRSPTPLEMFLRTEREGEYHFGAQGITPAEFASVFARDLRGLDLLVTRMPPELLNPNYWEPLTQENEAVVREKMGGIVTRTEGDRVSLWRSDRIARSRLLRDGIEAQAELVNGSLFKMTGAEFLKLAGAATGPGRLEAAGLAGLAGGVLPPELLSTVHGDLARGGLSHPAEVFLYTSHGDGLTRIVFAHAAHQRRAIEACLRGFVHAVVRRHVGHITGKTCAQIAQIADGIGLSATDRDVVDKSRTIEILAWMGRTPWGVSLKPGQPSLAGDERLLLYYDAIAGLWALST
jgi:hypothetical protein